MFRFVLVWCVFSVRGAFLRGLALHKTLLRGGVFLRRGLLRYGSLPAILALTRMFCATGLVGRHYRNRSAVATANYQSLTGQRGRINTAWVAARRHLLEEGATWGGNPVIKAQLDACTRELERVVAPLHEQGVPVILAPLHTVSDILAAMVGSGVSPGRASVVVSSSAEQYNRRSRELGGVNLAYCSIHQDDEQLAGQLMALLMEVASGQQNMIIFPDITPDYTLQTRESRAARLPCQLFGRAARLHSGIVRMARVVAAQVVFFNLYDRDGLKIRVHAPVRAKDVAAKMPAIIESTLREYPQDWLLWHSHSLYFINH